MKGRRLDVGGGIRTRARARAQAEQWHMVAAPARILALMADTLLEARECAPRPLPPCLACLEARRCGGVGRRRSGLGFRVFAHAAAGHGRAQHSSLPCFGGLAVHMTWWQRLARLLAIVADTLLELVEVRLTAILHLPVWHSTHPDGLGVGSK